MWIVPTLSALFSVLLLMLMGLARKLSRLRNDILASWKEIDHQLNRRYGLILDLSELAKPFLRYEQETLTLLSELAERAKSECERIISFGGPTTKQQSLDILMEQERILNEVLAKVTDSLISYSFLQSEDKIQEILEELVAASNRVGFIARSYNETVDQYNTTQRSFLGRLLASTFGHSPTEPFSL